MFQFFINNYMLSGSKVCRMKTLLFIIVSGLCISLAQGQPFPVTITISVSPPYPSHIYDYTSQPNKIMATLLNTSANMQTVYVLGKVSNGGNISVYTDPKFKMSPGIELQPGAQFRLNLDNLGKVFNADHLVFQGISRNEILTGNGLPEGDWTICLRAYDYKTNEAVSPEDPEGCSNTFSISDIEPPVMQKPECGQEIPITVSQMLPFLWTRPTGASGNIQYNLKIFVVSPGTRNINDAIKTGILPLFFETTVNTNSYLLGPTGPALIEGQTYACLITASDQAKKMNFRNHGESEVCSFTYGVKGIVIEKKDTTRVAIELITPVATDSLTNAQPLFKWQVNKSLKDVLFTVSVFEIPDSQDSISAFKNLKPVWTRSNIKESFLKYPGEFKQIEIGKLYAWQVTAIAFKGTGIGQSSYGMFGYSTAKLTLCHCDLSAIKRTFYVCQGSSILIPPPTINDYSCLFPSHYYCWSAGGNCTYLSGSGSYNLTPNSIPLNSNQPPGTYILAYLNKTEGCLNSGTGYCQLMYYIHIDGPNDAKIIAANTPPSAPVLADKCDDQDAQLVVPHWIGNLGIHWYIWNDPTNGPAPTPFVPPISPFTDYGFGNPKPLNPPPNLCPTPLGHYTRYYAVTKDIGGGQLCQSLVKINVWCAPVINSILFSNASPLPLISTTSEAKYCAVDLAAQGGTFDLQVNLPAFSPPENVSWTVSPANSLTWSCQNSDCSLIKVTIPVIPTNTPVVEYTMTAHVTNGPIHSGLCNEKTISYKIKVFPVLTGTLTSDKLVVCKNGDAVLTLNGFPAIPLKMQWQYSSDNSGVWTDCSTGDQYQHQTNEIGNLGPYIPAPQKKLCFRVIITNLALPSSTSICSQLITNIVCIDIKQPPCIATINGPTSSLCWGQSAILNAVLTNNPNGCDNNVSYIWKRNGMTIGYGPQFDATNKPGKYKVRTFNGCSYSTSSTFIVKYCIFDIVGHPCCISLSHSNGQVNVSVTDHLGTKNFSSCGGPYSITWTAPPGSSILSGVNTNQITATIPSNQQPYTNLSFSVTITDANNCTKTVSVDILVCP